MIVNEVLFMPAVAVDRDLEKAVRAIRNTFKDLQTNFLELSKAHGSANPQKRVYYEKCINAMSLITVILQARKILMRTPRFRNDVDYRTDLLIPYGQIKKILEKQDVEREDLEEFSQLFVVFKINFESFFQKEL